MENAAASDCPCIDSSQILSPRSNCITDDGSPGVWSSYVNKNTSAVNGNCYPVTYGSNKCGDYDMQSDPRCLPDSRPGYCKESFCYVDMSACKLSPEYVFRSGLLDDLYYSYSTCNSTSDSWLGFLSTSLLNGTNITVTVPATLFSQHYKTSESGEIAEFRGEEYYNESISWKGWQLEYFNAVASISNIGKITYTHQSKGADVKSPGSAWTATVHDVHAGLSCLAVSNFWITTERLKLAMFTAPVNTEKLYLYIKSPGAVPKTTFVENFQKTLAPFEPNVWFLILSILPLIAFLSVIFSNKDGETNDYWYRMRSPVWKESSCLVRAKIILKMGFDALLFETANAMTGSVRMDRQNSLAHKIINVGFAFFFLIVITAYTANLAAFLTVSLADRADYIKDMEHAVTMGAKICTYPGIKDDLSQDWPRADIRYFDTVSQNIQAFDSGDCEALIIADSDLLLSTSFMTEFCNRELVMTGPPVLTKAIGFPVCSDIGAGLSYWIYEAEKQGITYASFEKANRPQQICSFDFPDDTRNSELVRRTIQDFALPIMILVICIGLGILSHVWNWKVKQKDKAREPSKGLGESEHENIEGNVCTERSLSLKDENEDTVDVEQILDETKHMLEKLSTAAAQLRYAKKDN